MSESSKLSVGDIFYEKYYNTTSLTIRIFKRKETIYVETYCLNNHKIYIDEIDDLLTYTKIG